MKITLVDSNINGINMPIKVLSVCRQRACTESTLESCLFEKPQPHLSPLEFMWFCLHLEDIPIRVLWQLVRHRQFSFMAKSSRHNIMSEIVDLATVEEHTGRVLADLTSEQKEIFFKYGAEEAGWLQTMAHTSEWYMAGNGRVFYEYLQKRLCRRYVLPEHYELANSIYKVLNTVAPKVYNSSTVIPCSECGKCQGGR